MAIRRQLILFTGVCGLWLIEDCSSYSHGSKAHDSVLDVATKLFDRFIFLHNLCSSVLKRLISNETIKTYTSCSFKGGEGKCLSLLVEKYPDKQHFRVVQ